MTRLRFSAASGLRDGDATVGFAPLLVAASSSSAWRFRLASRCGGRSGPMEDILECI